MELVNAFLRQARDSMRDLLPVVAVIACFQLLVIRQPLPDGMALTELFAGLIFVLAGLTLFVQGLQIGIFPVGENLAHAFATKGSIFWMFLFAFALGFGTTVAEPALIAVASKAAEVMAEANAIAATELALEQFAFQLRMVVAVSVGVAVMIGVLRILKGWPLHLLIISGYVLVLLLTLFAPDAIVGIAYDSGGVTTSTITVPLLTALGVGLATAIKGRSPILDGFGLIALASVMPIIFVLFFGILTLSGGSA